MFDLKTDKWFIRVANEAQANAAQEWAFEQGFAWSGNKLLRIDFETWDDDGSKAIGHGHNGGAGLGQAGTGYWESRGHHELKVDFKLRIVNVVLPEVESPQQKQIKALEETIATAAAQIQKLKEGI